MGGTIEYGDSCSLSPISLLKVYHTLDASEATALIEWECMIELFTYNSKTPKKYERLIHRDESFF